MNSPIASVSVLALVLCASSASADELSFLVPFGPVAIGGSATLTLPRFDGSQGVLRLARIGIQGFVGGTWALENTSGQGVVVGGYASSQWIGAYVPVSLPYGGTPPLNPGYPGEMTPLSAFDGSVDYAGASGVALAFSNQAGDGGPYQEYPGYSDAALTFYSAGGTFDVTVGPMLRYGPSMLPPGVQDGSTVTVSGHVRVTYVYETPTTPICGGSSTSGCPCGNVGTVPRGCNNSTGSGGGLLAATGTASISADTLTLSGAGMTNSNALYFQGTTFQYAQSVYGDGLRCVTGNVVRLGTKTNSAGASSYPGFGDPSISVRGGVVAPGTRAYQVIYRDGGDFCTSSQFNATNGLLVLWRP